MRILVTGCNGYIGSHVVYRLKVAGHHITGWDINVHGEHNNIGHYLDVSRNNDVRDNYIEGEFDAVVHLAGLAVVPQSMITPLAYYVTNINGTANILKKVKTDHFLFASTSSAWEMASPYARSKVAAEDVIRQLSNDYTIFRFFNVSGTSGQFRQLGEATHLIRVAAEVAAGKRPYLNVFGTKYATRDGTCIRDYVHVMDLADAIAESIARGPARTPYECIGSNTGYTVMEVVDVMSKVTGKLIPIELSEPREGDAVKSVVDKLSPLVTLRRTIEDMCLSQYQLELSK